MANILPHSKYLADLFIHINGHSTRAYKLHGSQGKAASLVFQLVLISSINSLWGKGQNEGLQNVLVLSLVCQTLWRVVVWYLMKSWISGLAIAIKDKVDRSLGFTWVQIYLNIQYLRHLTNITLPNQRAAAVQ